MHATICALNEGVALMETGSCIANQEENQRSNVFIAGDVDESSLVDEAYNGFFEHAVEGFFQTTPEGRYLRANPALASMYGYESPEALIEALTDLNVQLYVDVERRAEFARLMRDPGAAIGFESQVFRRDGSVIWISENARVVRDESGSPILYEGTVQDITARKQTEIELKTSQRFIERVAQSSPNILYVYDLMQERYIYANERIFSILGHTLSELIEMGPAFLKKYSHPDDAWLLVERGRELAKAEDGEVFEYEFRLMHSNGNWCWVNARETVFTRTADGLPREIIGTAQDITEHTSTLKALQRSEERFRNLVEGADAVFWERELTTGRFIYVGPQAVKLLGYPGGGLVRAQILAGSRACGGPGACMQHWQNETSRFSGSKAIVYRMMTFDLRTVWVRDFWHIANDDSGAPVLQGFMLDITERQRAKEENLRSKQQLRALSARLQSAREEERIHIAREIHDELGGALTALKMDISRIAAACSKVCEDSSASELDEKLSAMPRLIDKTMETVRRLATELRPPVLATVWPGGCDRVAGFRI